MIKCVDDAKHALKEKFEELRNWEDVEQSFWDIAGAEAEVMTADLLDWYKDDLARTTYLGAAADRGFTDGLAILRAGQMIFIENLLHQAYDEIVQEAEEAGIADAQAELPQK